MLTGWMPRTQRPRLRWPGRARSAGRACLVQVSVVADDEGVLAPQLQSHGRQALRGSLHYAPAHLGAADEDELVDAPAREGRPGLGMARHYLHQPLWRACSIGSRSGRCRGWLAAARGRAQGPLLRHDEQQAASWQERAPALNVGRLAPKCLIRLPDACCSGRAEGWVQGAVHHDMQREGSAHSCNSLDAGRHRQSGQCTKDAQPDALDAEKSTSLACSSQCSINYAPIVH